MKNLLKHYADCSSESIDQEVELVIKTINRLFLKYCSKDIETQDNGKSLVSREQVNRFISDFDLNVQSHPHIEFLLAKEHIGKILY